MRAVVQRVETCRITVEGRETGSIGRGLLIYLGVAATDTHSEADYVVEKVSGLRIFEDGKGLMNLSVEETGGELMVVSQFTLYGDTRKGKRPSYSHAAPPAVAIPLYEYCVQAFLSRGFTTATGVFGAHMRVTYTNDGPVTILIDSAKAF